jgi:hypothetical protein
MSSRAGVHPTSAAGCNGAERRETNARRLHHGPSVNPSVKGCPLRLMPHVEGLLPPKTSDTNRLWSEHLSDMAMLNRLAGLCSS